MIGRRLGDFEISGLIGSGGMGTVYRARQQSLNRDVAVKVLPETLVREPAIRERFKAEALRMAQLTHPNIAQIYVVGDDDGAPYFAMQYLPGGTLEDRLRLGPLPVEQAANITAEIADALDYAHRQGIVHRDIKPANIIFDAQGRPLVTDFGIAKAGDEYHLTLTGMLMGTPPYMAPEQARGNPIDGRTDVYALGVVLYEMICGRPPFIGDTPLVVAMKHVNDPPPPPSVMCANVPPWLETIVLRALAKEPADRFPSAAALARALKNKEAQDVPLTPRMAPAAPTELDWGLPASARRGWSEPTEGSIGTRGPDPRPRSGRWLYVLMGLAALLALAGAAVIIHELFFTGNGSDGEPPPERNVSVPSVIGLSSSRARQELETRQLVVGKVGWRESTDEQREQVVDQSPPANTWLAKGEKVTLYLGSGPGKIQIPLDLEDQPVDYVERRLHDLGLRTERKYEERTRYAEGTVFGFDPSRGSWVEEGSRVVLLVSERPKPPPPPPVPIEQHIIGGWMYDEGGNHWTFREGGTAVRSERGESWTWQWGIRDGNVLVLTYEGEKQSEFYVRFDPDGDMHWQRVSSGEHFRFYRD